eukprot:scaffold3100_cov110-Isochrysis_galbana.AAC.1
MFHGYASPWIAAPTSTILTVCSAGTHRRSRGSATVSLLRPRRRERKPVPCDSAQVRTSSEQLVLTAEQEASDIRGVPTHVRDAFHSLRSSSDDRSAASVACRIGGAAGT